MNAPVSNLVLDLASLRSGFVQKMLDVMDRIAYGQSVDNYAIRKLAIKAAQQLGLYDEGEVVRLLREASPRVRDYFRTVVQTQQKTEVWEDVNYGYRSPRTPAEMELPRHFWCKDAGIQAPRQGEYSFGGIACGDASLTQAFAWAPRLYDQRIFSILTISLQKLSDQELEGAQYELDRYGSDCLQYGDYWGDILIQSGINSLDLERLNVAPHIIEQMCWRALETVFETEPVFA